MNRKKFKVTILNKINQTIVLLISKKYIISLINL